MGKRKQNMETDSCNRSIFSAVKRKFGENLVSRKKESLINEAAQRFWAYYICNH